MTIPTYSSFGRCKLSRIPAGTHSFWDCRTVLFHWLSEVKRPPSLRARNLKKTTKVSGSLGLRGVPSIEAPSGHTHVTSGHARTERPGSPQRQKAARHNEAAVLESCLRASPDFSSRSKH